MKPIQNVTMTLIAGFSLLVSTACAVGTSTRHGISHGSTSVHGAAQFHSAAIANSVGEARGKKQLKKITTKFMRGWPLAINPNRLL